MAEAVRSLQERRAGIDPDPARSHTLPGWAYTDPALFEREKEAVFYKTWHYAGALQELTRAGDYVTARLLDQSVVVLRGGDGALRGFYNVCQHRAHELLRGRGNSRVITCPYHAWSYETDGRLRTARGAEKLAGFDKSQFCLKPVAVEVFAGKFVFFNLDPAAQPLAEQAAGLADELARDIVDFARLDYVALGSAISIQANWKASVDNYLECFHCGPAHPAFADLIDMANYRTAVHAIWSSQKGALRKPRNKAYPVAEDARNKRGLFWWLWPTTVFNVMPGAPSLSVATFMPGAVARTDRWSQLFLPPGAVPDEARAAYGRAVLGPEDVALCEAVQRGLASRGYDAGRFVHDPVGGETTEAAVHHFHGLVAAALGI